MARIRDDGGVGGGEGGQLEAFQKDIDSSVVSSLKDKNDYNSQYRLRWSLAAVWHCTHPC